MNKKTITIFGSARAKEASSEWMLARRAGFLAARSGFCVCNGGYGGAMRASAKGAREAGGKTIGVTTREFRSYKNEYVQREICVPTWRERLFRLIDLADGFLVLDGGTGTLAELITVWEMRSKGMMTKPISVLGKFSKSAVRFLSAFPEIKGRHGIHMARTPEAAIRFLAHSLALC